MAELFLDNIYLLLLLPFWIFLIVMLGRFFSVYVNKFVMYALTLIPTILGIGLCSIGLWKLSSDEILQTGFQFIDINNFVINGGLHVDKTSLIFALILYLTAFCVLLFSISYMKNEKKTYRFYALMNLFNFSMAGLFFSPNLFQMYFFWEIIGVISYLLIGFDYFNKEKSLASKKAFIINRIGDTSLLAAILMSSYFIYSYAPNKSLTSLSFIDFNTISTLVYTYATTPLFEIICILFTIGIIVKSAQFPFYNWLQDAMQAKLPVSALLHSSTLVAAGIYLAFRLLPFFSLETIFLKSLIVIGLITALICSISACAQTNPKKVLAYSTSAQLGLIFLSIGCLNLKAAFAFFIAHAFIKSSLFLNLPEENKNWNFINLILFLINGISLSGLIFSGMLAKEMVATNLSQTLTTIFSIISFLTAFYIIKIALFLYDKHGFEKTKPDILKSIGIIGLLILNIGFYIYLHNTANYKIAEPFWAGLTGWVVVYILYIKKAFWRVPILYNLANNGFYLDKFYMSFCVKTYEIISKIFNFIDIRIFSNYKILTSTTKLSIKLVSFIENKIMNGTINFISKTFKRCSIYYLKVQNGSIQRYNMYAFIIIVITLLCVLFSYFLVIILGYLRG